MARSVVPRMKHVGNIVYIVDLRINETLQTGAVTNRTYQGRGESVSLFLEFTIVPILELLRHSQCTANPLNPATP